MMIGSRTSGDLTDVSDDGEVGFIPDGYVAPPRIETITPSDVVACLRRGLIDFERSKPWGLAFASVYVVGGLGLVAVLAVSGNEFLVFPAIAGFLLVGPITAVGLYEISRRLEAGEPLLARAILLAFMRHGGTQLLLFGAVLVFLMIVWMKAAALIYALAFGLTPMSFGDLILHATTSPRIALFLLAGNAIGALLAATAFSISVVAVPYLLDRDTDFMTALTTSLRGVAKNPVPMALFAIVIGTLTLLSVLTAFLGFFVTLPLIGHATWHLYRMLVTETRVETV